MNGRIDRWRRAVRRARLGRGAVVAALCLLGSTPAGAWFTLSDGEKGKVDSEVRLMFWGTASGGELVPPGTPVQEERIHDFLIRRGRLIVRMQTKGRLELYFQMGQDYAFSKIAADEAGLRIKDLYLNYRIAEAFQITAGQFKVPFLRQNLASAFNQLLVDRSAVPALRPAREGSRDTGAMLWGNLGTFQYRAALLDGSDQEDTNSRSALRGTARVAWNRFERETGLGATGTAIGAKRILQVAAQVDLQGARHDARDEIGFTTAWRDYRAWAGELFYDQPFDGGSALTVEAAWLERRDDYRDPGFATREIAASYAQAGWLLAPEIGGGRLQLAARYEKVRSDRGGLEARSTGRTIGVNWYAAGHDRKIQADYTRRNEEPVGIDNDEVRLSLVVVF